jgi:hypothetical protein
LLQGPSRQPWALPDIQFISLCSSVSGS